MSTLVIAVAALAPVLLAAQAKKPTPAAKPRSAAVPPKTTAAPPAPKVEKTVPFAVGETLTYDVSWSSFLTAGSATLTVADKKPADGSVSYTITAEGKPTSFVARLYNVYYKVASQLDAYSLLSRGSSTYSEEGRSKKTQSLWISPDRKMATYEPQAGSDKQQLKLPPDTVDALSALYVLRASTLVPGSTITLPVTDSGDLYTVKVTVENSERVTTGLGTANAIKLKPVIVNSTPEAQPISGLAMWVSEDARRLPLKISAELAVGSFVLTLQSVK